MQKYKEYIDELGNEILSKINDDGSISYIPKDEANSDYQAYLESAKDAANG